MLKKMLKNELHMLRSLQQRANRVSGARIPQAHELMVNSHSPGTHTLRYERLGLYANDRNPRGNKSRAHVSSY